jgi:purine nucleosidase
MLRFSNAVERSIVGGHAAPLHDPCVVAWLLRPELFRLRPCRIAVETESDLTRGHTAVEFRVPPDNAPHRWAASADGAAILDLLAERLA